MFYAATMKVDDDMMKHLAMIATLAQQLRELKEEIPLRNMPLLYLEVHPVHTIISLEVLNARKADEIDWDSIKGSLVEEYMKRKEKNDSLITGMPFSLEEVV